MTNLQQMIEEIRKRSEEHYNKHIAKMKEQFPQVDLEKAHIIMRDFSEMEIVPHDNNKVKYEIKATHSLVWDMNTDLGVAVEVFEELGWDYKEIEVGRFTLLVRDRGWDTVEVDWFNKETGRRVKGKRQNIKVGETSKGRFITIEKQRVYI